VLASLAPQKTNVGHPRETLDLWRFRIWCMYLPRKASSAALPKSMVQEEQTIRRWDGPEPVIGASGDWSREEAVEVGGERGDERREPIEPKFRHGAEGVADKRVW
jgi:hypothetical protein